MQLKFSHAVAILLLAVVVRAEQRPVDLVNRSLVVHVTAVIDGDTLDAIIPPARRVRIRLEGADAPELSEPFGDSARRFLRTLVFDQDVLMHGKDIDTYGRLVVRLTVHGQDASVALIRAGLGCTFRHYAMDTALEAALERARRDEVGFWAPNAKLPKCVARENEFLTRRPVAAISETSVVIGNVSSKVFHRPSCPNASCKNCTRRFGNRQAAETAGFRPAGDCF